MRFQRLGGWLSGSVVLAGLVGCEKALPPNWNVAAGQLSQAERLLKKQNYIEAIELLNKELQHAPTLTDQYFFRGEGFRLTGEADRAFDDYSVFIRRTLDALGILPPLSLPKEAQDRLAKAYLYRGAIFMDRGLLSLANRDLSDAINVDPNLCEAYYYRAKTVFVRPKTSEMPFTPPRVIEDCQMAIRLNPKHAKSLALLAEAYTFLKTPDNNQALKLNKLARQLDPDIPELVLTAQPISDAQQSGPSSPPQKQTGADIKAVDSAKSSTAHDASAISPDPVKQPDPKVEKERQKKEAVTLAQQGLEQFEKGQLDKAVKSLTDALAVFPDWVEVLYLRGKAHLEQKFPDTARQDFTHVLRLSPDHVDSYIGRAIAYSRLGRFYLAVDDCTAALRLAPGNANMHEYRGIAYLERGEFFRAVADLDEAIRLDPNRTKPLRTVRAKAYFGRGAANFLHEDWAEASHDLRLALILDARATKDRKKAYRMIADAEKELEDSKSALASAPAFKPGG